MPREFNPWFLEKEIPPDVEEGMTYLQILKRRLSLLIIFVFSNSLYDYAYILGIVALTVLVPLSQLQEPVIERDLIQLLCQAMSAVAAVPILFSLVIRFTMINFLIKNATEKKMRFWGLFFYVTLKATYFDLSARNVLPERIRKRLPKLPNKFRRGGGAGAPSLDAESGGESQDGKHDEPSLGKEGEGGDNESTGGNTEGSTDIERLNEGGDNDDANLQEDENSDNDDEEVVSDNDEEFEG